MSLAITIVLKCTRWSWMMTSKHGFERQKMLIAVQKNWNDSREISLLDVDHSGGTSTESYR